jgi:putative ABC transport system permease protein
MAESLSAVDGSSHFDDEHNDYTYKRLFSANTDSEMLLHVSTPLVLLTMTPLLIVIYISYTMELKLERPIVVGCVRTFVQLSILGMILHPIFVRGRTHSWLVLAYTTLMVLLAAYEATNQSHYKFPGMFLSVLACLGINVAWVSMFAFGVILRSDPLWDPQYVIPIVGMLLGNCVNGVSLSLNNMVTSLVEQGREIELYLSFGATPAEATARLIRQAVRVGAMPQLNSMAIIGIISIPGMMTGQILGGSPVGEAARYQMLIMYLIAMCTFGTILAEVAMALRAGFDDAHRLRTDFFVHSKSSAKAGGNSCSRSWSNFYRLCCCCFEGCYDWMRGKECERRESLAFFVRRVSRGYDMESTGLLATKDNISDETSSHKRNGIEFLTVRSPPLGPRYQFRYPFHLRVANLTHSFDIPEDDDEQDDGSDVEGKPFTPRSPSIGPRCRVLFADLNLDVKAGQMTLITGPSGAGKSTLLRLVAGLEPIGDTSDHHSGVIRLTVDSGGQKLSKTYDCRFDRTRWRNRVRYVPQVKADLPGTPKEFIHRITSLKESKHNSLAPGDLIKQARQLVQDWGMDAVVALESEWSTLSGGESQRVILAIALASRPSVLLLDEPTSALDLSSKLQVEQSVINYCQTYGTGVLWITHDPEQMHRLSQCQ